MTTFRIVPFINDGAIWWQLQRRGWLWWRGVWSFCTKDRAEDALKEFRGAFNGDGGV